METKEAIQMMDRAFLMLRASVDVINDNNAKYDPSLRRRLDFTGEAEAIAALRKLPEVAKDFLDHNLRNTLAKIVLCIEADQPRRVLECCWELEDVIEQIREGRKADTEALCSKAFSAALPGSTRG